MHRTVVLAQSNSAGLGLPFLALPEGSLRQYGKEMCWSPWMSWQQSPEPEASSWWFARPHCRVISRQRCCDSEGEGSRGRLRSALLSCCMWCGCQSCCPFLCLFYTGVTCSEPSGKLHLPCVHGELNSSVLSLFRGRKFVDFFWQGMPSKLEM